MALLPLGSWSSEGPFLSGSRFPPQSEAGVRTPVREVATSAPGGFPLPASVFPGVSLSCQEIPFEERMGTCICMAESPCCPPESITSLLISYAAAAKSLQSCPTLCDPIDGSLPDSPSLDSPGKNTGVGCHFLLQCLKVKSESEVTQSCPTLSDPMDCSLPGSSIHGIFQARVLEWGAIYSNTKLKVFFFFKEIF